MHFRDSDEAIEARAQLAAYLDEALTDELERDLYASGTAYNSDFTDGLIERGLFASHWPKEYGGGGRGPDAVQALRDEMMGRDAPTYANGTSSIVAKAILKFGPADMVADVLPRLLGNKAIAVLGFSEPEAGSDVANAQTRAVRDGDEWVISGSKMFTTNAQIADYVFLLTRSNTEVAKHKGLTCFLVPMKQAGVEVQAVYTISGERTNITYYNDVRVPDSYRIGDVDGGWTVMTSSLQDEHSSSFGARIGRALDAAEEWAKDTGRIDEPEVRGRLAKVAAETEVAYLLSRRAAWMDSTGTVPEAEGPMAKLFSSEAMVRASQELFDLVGPDALRARFDPSAPQDGRIEHELRFSLGTTIYAGTSEIQRGIIATRGLGLPR